MPAHLRDAHYPGAKGYGHGRVTSTPTIIRTASRPSSTCPTNWPAPVLPPTDHGAEAALAERLTRINELLGRT